MYVTDCRGEIIMKNSMIKKESQKTIIPPPYLISYAVTRKCNLKCRHCYSDATEESALDELSTVDAKRLIDEIADWGIKLLILMEVSHSIGMTFWTLPAMHP